ncbi:MAG: CBS and ACT domain-containing protein [Desulfovibrionaceae bacterium]|nr:CBS and ACT domain-containing protein [Desulfovibrionaceae bacterium]
MRTANWMTKEPVSVLPTTSLAKCQKLLKMHNIRRLPVVDEDNHVIGILSDRDVKSASPSKASSLEVHEMNYLLAEVKAKDIMATNPITVKSEDSIADVARLMLDEKVGGFPVVDDENHLIGVITDQDIFKVFVDICGAHIKGIDITIECSDEPGTLAFLLEIIVKYNGRIISVLTSFLPNGDRHIFLRLHPMPADKRDGLHSELAEKTKLLAWNE